MPKKICISVIGSGDDALSPQNAKIANEEYCLPEVLKQEPVSYRYDIFVSYCDADSPTMCTVDKTACDASWNDNSICYVCMVEIFFLEMQLQQILLEQWNKAK